MSIATKTIRTFLLLALGTLLFGTGPAITKAQSAQSQPSTPPYIVEWVYKVKFGHQDEFWQIFKKYQIATLNKEKELGGVLKYEVFRPGLHTSEDHRWDYRIVIYYKNSTSSSQARAIEKQLFPDQAAMQREETRRWELTEVHWDLPIRQIDPNAAE
jgi:hypothetical protein